jgi:hypothetical protein
MKIAGLILGIFFLVIGGSLFISSTQYGGYSLAFLTWGILLYWWYWGQKKGRIYFNLGRDEYKRLKLVVQNEKVSISEIMRRAFSEYYERWSQKENSLKSN